MFVYIKLNKIILMLPKGESYSHSHYYYAKSPNKERSLSNIRNPEKSYRKSPSKQKQVEKLAISEKLMLHQKKLKESLQIYNVIDHNKLTQRCIQHNTDISLYCLNQHRLICVNCVYGNRSRQNNHKKHQIFPLQSANNQIKKDNVSNSHKLTQNLNNISHYETALNQDLEQSDITKNSILTSLEKDFDQIMRMMSNKFLELKIQILEKYEDNVRHISGIIKQLKSIKEISQENVKSMEYRNDKLQDNIFKHLILSRLVECTSAKERVEDSKRGLELIQKFARGEMKKLREYILTHKWKNL